MLTQYPAIKPFNTFKLAVDEPHELYVEQCGNPEGLPVVFIHGGPGAGCSESDRCFFDPDVYHIILFDQRGAGRSTPHACLENNTTEHLIADIEKIREYLGVDSWLVFGGSWGSTLSLTYAQAHPERVRGLIVRGIFLGREKDIAWYYQPQGAAMVFPDYFEDFIAPLAGINYQSGNEIATYYELLTSEDEVKRMAAAKAWSVWEGRGATLRPDEQLVAKFGSPHFALSIARIECHYFMNKCFLSDNQILANMDKLADIPGIIVQGRYDMICLPEQAWLLHKAWPGSQLNFIRDAGHASGEAGIIDALIRATQTFANQLA